MKRNSRVDRTLREGELISEIINEEYSINAKHYGILIEDAIKEDATFILAPDGISGNLIFRTLEFLGGGSGIGAIYSYFIPKKIFIDISRKMKDYTETIAFASFISSIIPSQP